MWSRDATCPLQQQSKWRKREWKVKQKCYPESEGVHSWGICYLVCPASQINELKVCKRDSVCWKASIWFLCLMQLYQASTSRNWWGLWPRFCKQGIEALTHLSVLMGTLNSDDWLCKTKVTGLTSLAKSLLMLMCLVPGLRWASFRKRRALLQLEKPRAAQI